MSIFFVWLILHVWDFVWSMFVCGLMFHCGRVYERRQMAKVRDLDLCEVKEPSFGDVEERL